MIGRVIVAGCGYLGEAVAGLFLRDGVRVLGLTAGGESARRLGEIFGGGLEGMACDVGAGVEVPREWRGAEVLVHCASTKGGTVEAYRWVYLRGLRNLLAEVEPELVVFVSSTSVYGQVDGGWVDEGSETEPAAETGRVLLEAEGEALEAGGLVLRLAGIYGPGRSVYLRKYVEERAVLEGGGDRWVNQIHRDDAARALVWLVRGGWRGVFNVCDDEPARLRRVYGWIAEHLGGELPPEGAGVGVRKRGQSNKRVSNLKLRSTGWEPQYANYLSALRAGAVSWAASDSAAARF